MRLLSLRPALVLVPLAFAGLVACDNGPVALGGDETDDFLIADAAATAHLGRAIDGGDALTFRQVIEQGDGLVFSSTPDPSTLLSDTNVVDDTRVRTGRRPLSMMTYNVALLDVNIFGVIPYAETPDLQRRRDVIAGLIFDRGVDVVLLQEVWLAEDVEEFTRTAEEFDYRVFLQDRTGHNDGLMTLVRKAIIQPGTESDFDYGAYGSQSSTEYFPGPGIQRGWNSVRFIHRDIGPIQVFNTHMQAFSENWLGRVKQSRELGILMRSAVDSEETHHELVFAGGDFNAGPYYKNSNWKLPDGSEQDIWLHNAISYPVLLAYGDLVDLAIMGRPAADALADVVLGNTVVNDPGKSVSVPGADEGWCETTPHTTFTASDCNSLYFAQYAGTEFPARLDHLFAHDPDERIVVTSSALTFTEKVTFGDKEVEPSDHYAVVVEMLVSAATEDE
jgi:endonuclease/exonuclease/phosphatase family metal-dependent hydrolase